MLWRWLLSLSLSNQPLPASKFSAAAHHLSQPSKNWRESWPSSGLGSGLRESCGWLDLLFRPLKVSHFSNKIVVSLSYQSSNLTGLIWILFYLRKKGGLRRRREMGKWLVNGTVRTHSPYFSLGHHLIWVQFMAPWNSDSSYITDQRSP